MRLKKNLSNLCEYSFILIFIILLINSLLVFTDRNNDYLIFFNTHNKEIFNFSYLGFFFILSLSYLCNFSNYSFKDKKLIPLYFLLFYVFCILTLNFTFEGLKNSLQLLIIFLLYFFITGLNISKLKIPIFISNIIIFYSIFVELYDFKIFNDSFFYIFSPELLGIQTLNFLEGKYPAYVTSSQFNFFNIIIICFFFINIILKSYRYSWFNLFIITFIFFYLILFSNLYTKIILIFFVIFYLVNYKKLFFNKLFNLFLLLLIIILSFYMSNKNIDNVLVKILNKIDYPKKLIKTDNAIHCLPEGEILFSNNSSIKQNVCFQKKDLYYHLKSFRIRQSFQNKIFNELYSNKSNLIFGLKKNDLKNLYSKGIFPHNSFLDILMKHGLLGLILFLLVILYLLNKHYSRKSIIFALPIFSLMAFDDYLIGNMFYTSMIIWTTIYISLKVDENNNES
jgi:hypothetical protein